MQPTLPLGCFGTTSPAASRILLRLPFCSLEQMRSLQNCSRAVDIHDINFDPCKAKVLTVQLAKCFPDLPPGQKNSVLGSRKSTSVAKTLSNTSSNCRAKTRKNAACWHNKYRTWSLSMVGKISWVGQMSHDIIANSSHWYARFETSRCGYRCVVDSLDIKT